MYNSLQKNHWGRIFANYLKSEDEDCGQHGKNKCNFIGFFRF